MSKARENTGDSTVRRRIRKNRLFQGGVILFSMVTISPILLIIYKLVAKGYRQINFDFFTKNAPDTYEAMVAVGAGEIIPGGILNGITGTLYMVLIASLMAIPVGLLIGIFLYDQKSKRYAGLVRDIVDILQGVPSIVLGLIAYFWVVKNITHGFSALAGSTALAIMMLPLIIRSTEETLKMIPETIRRRLDLHWVFPIIRSS